MKYVNITQKPRILKGPVHLPASKSISNRVLVIRALCASPFIIQNLSKADDTVLMESLFKSNERELYVKNAGTVARFLIPFYASRPGDVILKGNERMNARPIGALVNALIDIGADIEYLNKEGNLPVHIHGKFLKGGQVSIAADQSSQFVSALALIAPPLKEGLTIDIAGDPVSEPYINMTLNTMAYFGIHFNQNENRISIPHQKYLPRLFFVESDWSSASYFFALSALFPGTEMTFPDLYQNSIQGDHIICRIIREFGVEISFHENNCQIKSTASYPSFFRFDFINHPDLIPTFVCLCCALRIPFEITGTRTLKHKESDRAEVLKSELIKLGYSIELQDNLMSYDGNIKEVKPGMINLDTHGDHRLAMSFAILASKNPDICMVNPEVVDKSFPDFWEQISNLGFSLTRSDI